VVRVDLRRRTPDPLSQTGRLVALGEARVCVHEWGARDAPAALYLHGLGGTGLDVADAARVLVDEHGLRVLAGDAPGLGSSPRLSDRRLDTGALADLVGPLLDATAVERCALVGHSWGGGVALRAAAADPRRVRAVALLDGGYLDPRDWPRGWLRRRVPRAAWERAGAGGAWAEAVHAHMREEPAWSTYPALAAARIPVLLLLAGAYDAALSSARRSGLARLHAALPGAEVRELEGAGHDLPRERGAEVGRIVGEWLARYTGDA